MSPRSTKRLRRRLHLRATAEELDRRKRAEMRVPWWVWLVAGVIDPQYRGRWVQDWQRRHEEKVRRAYRLACRATVKFARRIS